MQTNLYDAFIEAVYRFPRRTAIRRKDSGKFQSMTFGQIRAQVDAVAAGFRNLGIGHGNVIGIYSANRPEWILTDLAALKIGAIVVPVYPTMSATMLKYIINDSRMRLMVVENGSLLSKLRSILDETSCLRAIVVIEPTGNGRDTLPFSRLAESISTSPANMLMVTGEDTATIAYTSGTTGDPKGVVLTHRNILANVEAVVERFGVTHRDVTVSYLPLCHMFERTCGYYAILLSGGCVAYAENLTTVLDDVRLIKPTVMIAVPRVLEKAFENAVSRVQRNSGLMRKLVAMTMRDLNRRADLRYQKKSAPVLLRLRCLLLNHLVATRFRSVPGRRLRLIACGGAPLDRKLAKAYHILGFHVIEGYGLTESSPVVACNSVTDNRLGTVGKPLSGIEVKIGPMDEILVRGPNIMRGYLNKPNETEAILDSAGWLHTGDQGRIGSDGHLTITGRIKDLIVTSGGKKIAASPIETLLQRSMYVAQAVVFGDRRKYLAALIVPRRSAIEEHAEQIGIAVQDYSELLRTSEIRNLIQREIAASCETLAPHEQIKAFALLDHEFATEDGLVTPTLKIRRQAVEAQYHDIIERLYQIEEAFV